MDGGGKEEAELEGKFHDEGKAVESKDDVGDSGSDSDTDDEDRKAEDAALAGRLEAYFLEDPFKTEFAEFMTTGPGSRLQPLGAGGEQPLENYAVFQEYGPFVENMLEAFTVKEYFSEGMTVTDVASACQRLADSGDTRVGTIEYVLAAMDFDIFMKIANEARA